jgi:ADP-ribosyl-[dinitrogen reductase] hydrolase
VERRRKALEGCLIGMAVGDSLGLPREGLSPDRASRLYGTEANHRFLFGKGMVSDDTEHAIMTVQAFLKGSGDEGAFARSLGWSMRGWLLALPAGVGLATLKATLKLWIGFPPSRSGVYSAGNGPAMRAPVLGTLLAGDTPRLFRYVEASTKLTHTHPLALEGANIIAYTTAFASSGEVAEPLVLLEELRKELELSKEWDGPLDEAGRRLREGGDSAQYAAALNLGKGVSGYILHTVPACLYCWLTNQNDYRKAIENALTLGGDTDTVAAISGGMVGAGVGLEGIPKEWVLGVKEWPRSVAWMQRLAARASQGEGPLPWLWMGQIPRNLVFLVTVLFHGFRRLFPPY